MILHFDADIKGVTIADTLARVLLALMCRRGGASVLATPFGYWNRLEDSDSNNDYIVTEIMSG